MGRIVVGVDGSAPSLKALVWAQRQAELSGADLEAVTSWDFQAWAATVPGAVAPDFNAEELAHQIQDEAIGKVLDAEAARKATRTIVLGSPGRVLLERAEGAELLVVGDRGHTGLVATLLGSVSLHVTQHAPCPVTVVRGAVS
ncbi:universal stress protein [Streptomyces sp. NPDC058401]|uniref:universal stress protein n=1 Tax=Streptomyces sp. NPDC058401 TaxID=3346480 RepID=UPI0036650ED9